MLSYISRANKLSYEIAFNLTSYLHKETEYVPWRAFLDSINFVKGMLATSNSFGFLQVRFKGVCLVPAYNVRGGGGGVLFVGGYYYLFVGGTS